MYLENPWVYEVAFLSSEGEKSFVSSPVFYFILFVVKEIFFSRSFGSTSNR